MKNIAFYLFVLLASGNLWCQTNPPVQYPYQSVFVGLDSYIGYNKIGDAFKRKYSGSTNPYMRNFLIPSVGISHRFNQKTILFAKAGYGFAKSDGFDSLVGNETLLCNRKIRALKFDLEAQYVLFIREIISMAIAGEVGYNFLTEKLSCVEDYKYGKVGFGGGIIFYYHFQYAFNLKYYKIGANNFLGGGINIPIFSNRND